VIIFVVAFVVIVVVVVEKEGVVHLMVVPIALDVLSERLVSRCWVQLWAPLEVDKLLRHFLNHLFNYKK
jgi:hypothetical protein